MYPKMFLFFDTHQGLEFFGLQNPSASPFEQEVMVSVVLGAFGLQCAEPFPASYERFFVLFWNYWSISEKR